MLDTFKMVVTAFSMTDKAHQVRFFEKTFLVANISPEVVFGMPFLTLSGADVDFSGRKLRWKTYTTKEVLPTTKRIELVGKKEFAAAALDPKSETFVVHVASLSSDASLSSSPLELNVHPSRRPQVSDLIAKKALTKIPTEHLDFADVFSPDLASGLPEYIGINDHANELVNSQEPPYEPTYSLRPIDFGGLHWDQSSQWARQTIQVTRRCSYPFQPEVGRVTLVVCGSELPKHTGVNNYFIDLSPKPITYWRSKTVYLQWQ